MLINYKQFADVSVLGIFEFYSVLQANAIHSHFLCAVRFECQKTYDIRCATFVVDIFFLLSSTQHRPKKKKNGSNNTFFAKCSWLARAIQRSAAPRRKNEKRRSNNCVSRRKKNSLYADEFLRISAGTAYSGKVPCCISKNMLTIFPNGDRLFHSTRCPFDWRQTRDAMTA